MQETQKEQAEVWGIFYFQMWNRNLSQVMIGSSEEDVERQISELSEKLTKYGFGTYEPITFQWIGMGYIENSSLKNDS